MFFGESDGLLNILDIFADHMNDREPELILGVRLETVLSTKLQHKQMVLLNSLSYSLFFFIGKSK